MGSHRWKTSILLLLAFVSHAQLCSISYPNCSCSLDSFDLFVRCTSGGFSLIPNDFPYGVTTLHFIGNHITLLEKVTYTGLRTLLLERNGILFIKGNAFPDLTHLQILSLQYNGLTGLRKEMFQGLTSLNTLLLSGNPIFELKEFTFLGTELPMLYTINLGESHIYEISPHAFDNFNHLNWLNLSHNHIRDVKVFQQESFQNIKFLDLSYNDIENFSGASFENMENLHSLQLAGNKIEVITIDTFKGLVSVQILSLRNNSITSLPAGCLNTMPNLTQLDISFNALTWMDHDGKFSQLPKEKLSKVLVHDNPWDCTCHNSWLINVPLVSLWNINMNMKCQTPSDLSGKDIYSLKRELFSCWHTIHSPNLALAAGLIFSFLAITSLIVILYCKVVKKRLARHRSSGASINSSLYRRFNTDREVIVASDTVT